MSTFIVIKRTSLLIAATFASLLAATSFAQSSDYVRFQLEIVPVNDGTLVPLPNIAATLTPQTVISPGAAAQLTSIVNSVLAKRTDRAAFEPQYDGQTWKLAVRTEPRSDVTSALVEPLLTKFIDCIDSLDSSVSKGELIMAADGFAPDDVNAAKEAAAQLIKNIAAGCTPKTHLVSVDQNRARITLESMLSGHFNSMQIALSEVNTIAAILNSPILGETGLYAHQRSDELHEILTDAFSHGLPSESVFDTAAGVIYETFFDFVLAPANHNLASDYFVNISRACIANVDALYRPFSLSSCISSGKLTKLKFWLNGQGYVLAAEVR